MPLARYFVYVGSVLLALLFLADATLPKLPVVAATEPHLPVIRIFAERRGPGPIVFDTNAVIPAPSAMAAASVPPPAAVADANPRVRDAFAQLTPPDTAKVQAADPKKVEARQPPPPPVRKVARRHTAPPQRLAAPQQQQQQFAWFGPRMW